MVGVQIRRAYDMYVLLILQSYIQDCIYNVLYIYIDIVCITYKYTYTIWIMHIHCSHMFVHIDMYGQCVCVCHTCTLAIIADSTAGAWSEAGLSVVFFFGGFMAMILQAKLFVRSPCLRCLKSSDIKKHRTHLTMNWRTMTMIKHKDCEEPSPNKTK